MELTRRTALVSLVVIGLAAAGAGAGTMALFSDTEDSTDNTVTAGSLDLVFGETETKTLDVSDAKPEDSDSISPTIENGGSLDGSVDVDLGEARDGENGVSEAEEDDDPDGETSGELSDNLKMTIFIDYDQDGSIDEGPDQKNDVVIANGETLSAVANKEYEDAALASGEKANLYVGYKVDDTESINSIQSDDVKVDITVELNQEDSQ